MGKLYEYYLNVRVIKDLPKNTENIIRILMGEFVFFNEDEIPEIDLPEHELFENGDWSSSLRVAFADTGYPHTLQYKDKRIFVMMETENPDATRNFIDWVFPYLVRPADPRCIGYFRAPGAFPSLIVNAGNELYVIDTKKVFCGDRPVIVNPEDKSITVMPSMDEVKKMFKGKFDELLKSVKDPESLN